MRGAALITYEGLPAATKNNVILVQEAHTRKYNTPEKQWQLRSKLYSLKQEGDNLEQFIKTLDKLSQKCGVADNTKMDLFITGLNEKLKEALLLRQPANYNAALSYARLKQSASSTNSEERLIKRLLETLNKERT